jgi:hypothetical protein
MSNLKTYVEVELNGKTRLLKYDFNAVADIEEYFGRGIGAIFSETQVGLNTIRVFYWGGLKWKEKGVTPQVVGNWLGAKLQEGENMETLMRPIFKALKLSGIMGSELGDDEEEENDYEEQPEKN